MVYNGNSYKHECFGGTPISGNLHILTYIFLMGILRIHPPTSSPLTAGRASLLPSRPAAGCVKMGWNHPRLVCINTVNCVTMEKLIYIYIHIYIICWSLYINITCYFHNVHSFTLSLSICTNMYMIVQIICICIYAFDTFLMYRQPQPDNLASLDLKWKYTCRFPMATLSDFYQSPNEIHTWLCLRDHRFYHH